MLRHTAVRKKMSEIRTNYASQRRRASNLWGNPGGGVISLRDLHLINLRVGAALLSALVLCLTLADALGGDWPMFHGGPSLTGVASGELPAKMVRRWAFKTAGPVKSSAAIVQGQVFIGSGDSNVYALTLTAGKKTWSFKTAGEVESSPLVLEQKVYVGASDGVLYSLEAGTGKAVWKYQTDDKILGSPNWHNGGGRLAILVGSYDFKLHCVDALTGKSNWVYETGNYINGCPAVSGGWTVFGGCDGLLHVIGLADGHQVKKVEAGAYIAGSG